tara:strand:- start:57 stop:743 length:687 start_codon:yes stop_codon:yes gene_type:complete
LPNKNPKHIAIILDGNKRWASVNKLSSIEGYKRGLDKILEITEHCVNLKIQNLTLFTLSSENLKRENVNIIFKIAETYFQNFIDKLVSEKQVKVKVFGTENKLPSNIVNIIKRSEKLTSENNQLNLNLAFNYGFTEEIKNLLKKISEKNVEIDFNNENNIRKLFYLEDNPDPDILIRTGGYKRLSNFIMYNLIYTELFFIDDLWPDFTKQKLDMIINDFKSIKRKYGL